MPRKPKKARELTTDEVMKRLFPKEVRMELKRVAHENDAQSDKRKSNHSNK
ncbi:MAG: hypothetical protein HUU46_23405 [Candidatus Hydrogenedentes bacterium]|nr:hypothetical protein [Candidatus Hydrogenedentota bacterium]